MATKITIEFDDQTPEAFRKLVGNLEQSARSADKTQQSVDRLGNETRQAAQQAGYLGTEATKAARQMELAAQSADSMARAEQRAAQAQMALANAQHRSSMSAGAYEQNIRQASYAMDDFLSVASNENFSKGGLARGFAAASNNLNPIIQNVTKLKGLWGAMLSIAPSLISAYLRVSARMKGAADEVEESAVRSTSAIGDLYRQMKTNFIENIEVPVGEFLHRFDPMFESLVVQPSIAGWKAVKATIPGAKDLEDLMSAYGDAVSADWKGSELERERKKQYAQLLHNEQIYAEIVAKNEAAQSLAKQQFGTIVDRIADRQLANESKLYAARLKTIDEAGAAERQLDGMIAARAAAGANLSGDAIKVDERRRQLMKEIERLEEERNATIDRRATLEKQDADRREQEEKRFQSLWMQHEQEREEAMERLHEKALEQQEALDAARQRSAEKEKARIAAAINFGKQSGGPGPDGGLGGAVPLDSQIMGAITPDMLQKQLTSARLAKYDEDLQRQRQSGEIQKRRDQYLAKEEDRLMDQGLTKPEINARLWRAGQDWDKKQQADENRGRATIRAKTAADVRRGNITPDEMAAATQKAADQVIGNMVQAGAFRNPDELKALQDAVKAAIDEKLKALLAAADAARMAKPIPKRAVNVRKPGQQLPPPQFQGGDDDLMGGAGGDIFAPQPMQEPMPIISPQPVGVPFAHPVPMQEPMAIINPQPIAVPFVHPQPNPFPQPDWGKDMLAGVGARRPDPFVHPVPAAKPGFINPVPMDMPSPNFVADWLKGAGRNNAPDLLSGLGKATDIKHVNLVAQTVNVSSGGAGSDMLAGGQGDDVIAGGGKVIGHRAWKARKAASADVDQNPTLTAAAGLEDSIVRAAQLIVATGEQVVSHLEGSNRVLAGLAVSVTEQQQQLQSFGQQLDQISQVVAAISPIGNARKKDIRRGVGL